MNLTEKYMLRAKQKHTKTIDNSDKNQNIDVIHNGEVKIYSKKLNKEVQQDSRFSVPLSDETLSDLFLETMDTINDRYIEGSCEYIEKNYPDLDAKINATDNRIEEIWQECNKGKASLEDFKEILSSYENIYLKNFESNEAKKLLQKQSNEDSVAEKICARCGKTGERFCYGETESGKYKYGFFCLECYPHHF